VFKSGKMLQKHDTPLLFVEDLTNPSCIYLS